MLCALKRFPRMALVRVLMTSSLQEFFRRKTHLKTFCRRLRTVIDTSNVFVVDVLFFLVLTKKFQRLGGKVRNAKENVVDIRLREVRRRRRRNAW